MAKYIECEAALSFPFANGQYDHKNADPHFINGCESYREWLETIPAADVAPVVRCKDCRKGIPDSEHATAYSCYGIWHKPDWFCAGGVKEEGDGD